MKVGLHQGIVSSLLLFSVVMDVVSSEDSSGLPSELSGEELVLMAPAMENLAICVAEWGVLLAKY